MFQIPDWLHKEVDEYFVQPLNFVPDTILDIGANVGAFALRAHQQWPAAKVICYEPMPFNLEQLRLQVSEQWCQVVPCAVRASAGEDNIFIGDMFVTGGFVKGTRQTNQTIRVNCVAASELPSAALVKIDTEGSEVEILRHLNLTNTRGVMLEHHSLADAQRIKTLLSEAGLRIVHDESAREIGTMIFLR